MFTFPLMDNGWQVHPLINLSSCGMVSQVNLLQHSEGTLQMSTRSGEFFFLFCLLLLLLKEKDDDSTLFLCSWSADSRLLLSGSKDSTLKVCPLDLSCTVVLFIGQHLLCHIYMYIKEKTLYFCRFTK